MNALRRFGYLSLLFCLLSLGVFYRSLSYSFHYDDYSKLILNPATTSIVSAAGAFLDRNRQSTDLELNTHLYRPLLVVLLAVERALVAERPAGYRVISLALHGVNAALVALVGCQLLGIGALAGVVGGLVFLLHPAQTESVVWISEQSNLVATTLFLFALMAWANRKERLNSRRATTLIVLFGLGLLIKESMAAFPFAMALIVAWKRERTPERSEAWQFVGLLFVLLGTYLYARHQILGRTSNIWMDSFTWRGYLAPIFVGAAMALKFLIWPLGTSINHRPWPAPANDALLFTFTVLVPLLLFCGAVWMAARRRSKVAFCIALMIVLWLPTSQIIPIKSIFSERFLYLVLIPFSWLIGLLFERLPSMGRGAILFYIVTLAALTTHNLPVWQNDGTLWDNAVDQDPTYWNTWVQSAEWEKANAFLRVRLGQPEPEGWKERAEEKYIKGLKCGFPISEGAPIFLRLARINFQQGKWREAEEHGKRAVALRPDLQTAYDNLRRHYVDRR